MDKEYILCAAIHFDDQVTRAHQPKNIHSGIVIAGRRHHNCFLTAFALSGQSMWDKVKHIEGFLTNKNRFVDRREGYEIAKREGQLYTGLIHDDNPILISEELY